MTDEEVLRDLKGYCKRYNLPINHIVEVLSELKVVPMIRGISFEFSVLDSLRSILDENRWFITKPNINAQASVHDVDVEVTNLSTGTQIRIECKLAGKDTFRILDRSRAKIKVKCMRSRTVNRKAARYLANRYGVSVESVLAHADNYRESDFDFVITSMGNALWRTDRNGQFVFLPTDEERDWLERFFGEDDLSLNGLQDKCFNYFLIAPSSALIVSRENNITCKRRRCISAGTHHDCGFIPNYPEIILGDQTRWKEIRECESLFEDFIRRHDGDSNAAENQPGLFDF